MAQLKNTMISGDLTVTMLQEGNISLCGDGMITLAVIWWIVTTFATYNSSHS